MGKLIDLTGQTFGRLTVLRRAPDHRERVYWECRCQCGNTTVVGGTALRRGNSHSCGCLVADLLRNWSTTHGQSRSVEYYTWQCMKTRCYNEKHSKYRHYGGRGITICDDWRNDFERFYADMGPRPAGHSIDRINNDGNYEPSNCRWVPRAAQNANTRQNRLIEFRGETHTLAEWARRVGLPPTTLRGRLQENWTIERAMTERA